MQAPDLNALETRLAQLMPVALSDQGAHELETLVDRLAQDLPLHSIQAPQAIPFTAVENRRTFPWFGGAAAAAAGWLAAVLIPFTSSPEDHFVATKPIHEERLVLIGETDVVESIVDEGWISNPDGIEMQAVRVLIRAENRLRDAETGIVVKISEPREEMIYLPVTAF